MNSIERHDSIEIVFNDVFVEDNYLCEFTDCLEVGVDGREDKYSKSFFYSP